MKKSIICAAVVLAAGVAGCENGDPITAAESETQGHGFYKNISALLWVDPETGCEYLSGSKLSAMTPRLDKNGKQICR